MLYSKLRCLSLAIGLTLIWSCSTPKEIVQEDPISIDKKFAFDFVRSEQLTAVLDKADAEGKLVFLDVYTSWCLPCKMMDEDVFTNESTAGVINKDFISYKVDAEKANGPDLALIYEIKSYPTLLFLDPKGRVLERKEGAAYHTELIALADSARGKYPQ